MLRGGNKRTVAERDVVNGGMFILSTGCQWASLPKDLPPHSTVNDYFRRHLAQNTSGRSSGINGRTTRHPVYAVSQRIRKRIEEAFGWAKTVAGLRKARHRGLPKATGSSPSRWPHTTWSACRGCLARRRDARRPPAQRPSRGRRGALNAPSPPEEITYTEKRLAPAARQTFQQPASTTVS